MTCKMPFPASPAVWQGCAWLLSAGLGSTVCGSQAWPINCPTRYVSWWRWNHQYALAATHWTWQKCSCPGSLKRCMEWALYSSPQPGSPALECHRRKTFYCVQDTIFLVSFIIQVILTNMATIYSFVFLFTHLTRVQNCTGPWHSGDW